MTSPMDFFTCECEDDSHFTSPDGAKAYSHAYGSVLEQGSQEVVTPWATLRVCTTCAARCLKDYMVAPLSSPAVICAWCSLTIHEGREPATHTICPACEAKWLSTEMSLWSITGTLHDGTLPGIQSGIQQ